MQEIFVDIRDGVTYNFIMQHKAPTNAVTLIGAEIRTFRV
jgi:hypothetical protein